MIENKIVVFEEINSGFISIASSYLNDGFTVYFFSIENRIKKQKTIQWYLETNKLIDLSKVSYEHLIYCRTESHKNLDLIFEKYFSKSQLIDFTSNLLGSHEIKNMYKKELLKNLEKIYDLEMRVNDLTKNNQDEIFFYPCQNFEMHLDESTHLAKNVKVIEYKNYKIRISNFSNNFRTILSLFFSIYLFFRKIRWITLTRKPRKTFKIGLKLNLPGLFSYNNFYIDYIIGKKYNAKKNDILLIDESNEFGLPSSLNSVISFLKATHKKSPYEKESKNLEYNYMHIVKTKEGISIDILWNKFIKVFFPAWIKCFFYSFLDKKPNIDVTAIILSDYVKWNIFLENYSINNHVTVLLPDNASKNIILSANDQKTWFVYPDNTATDYHTGLDENQSTSIVFSFINSDYAVVYGNKIKRYFTYNRNDVKNYITLGVMAAQTVRELREGKLESKLPLIIEKKNLPEIIIGVFDTSFVDFGPLKIKDGIRFGEDILRLLDEMPEIGVIFKEKKHLSVTPQLAPVYEKLENHERCVVVRKTDTDCIFSTEVIALSDLVISAAYTSTNAEALGAKTKAIYYDVAGTDIGDNYYFNKFPNFVAHDYDELKKLVKYWLYDVNDEQFEEFLNMYVKGEIDPYLDGKAIDRLHALLNK